MSLVVVFCWFVILAGQLRVGTVKIGPQKMTFRTPNISDEEAHSNFMPDQLKCDACRIVAYQVTYQLVLVLVLVLGDDELQSQSAVDAHIFPMLVQTVFEHIN